MIFKWGNVEKGADKAGKRTMQVTMLLTCAENHITLKLLFKFLTPQILKISQINSSLYSTVFHCLIFQISNKVLEAFWRSVGNKLYPLEV
jgi:TRAP-type C4-dicarboxylate transport system permease small subunit